MTSTTIPCTYSPTAGTDKGKQCIREDRHPGPHLYNQAKLDAYLAALPPQPAITDAEIADAITQDEIQRRSEALDDAQGIWERYVIGATQMRPCPECTGRGAMVSGSLGDLCPVCQGRRVVPDDAAEPITMPDFAALRAPLTKYGNALVFRAHGKPAELPAASTVPTMAQIELLRTDGRAKHKTLAAGGAPPAPALPSGPATDPESGWAKDEAGGIEDTASDAELDAIEAEIVGETKK